MSPQTHRIQAAEQIALGAAVLLAGGDLMLAEQAVRLALAADPALPNAHGVYAAVLEEGGAARDSEALHHRREAAYLAPHSPGHRFNLALSLLGRGDWADGLPLYEARLDKDSWTSLAALGTLAPVRDRLARPTSSLAGRRVLAFTEQGIGDCIWAARFLPQLAAQGAVVTLACRPPLVPLLGGLPGVAAVLSPQAEQPDAKLNIAALAGQHDLFTPLMSLPWVLGLGADGTTRPSAGRLDIPATTSPYLAADPARVAAWRQHYRDAHPGASRVAGVVWRASPTGPASTERAILPAHLAPLAAVPGLDWVNLQGGPVEGRDAILGALPGCYDPLAPWGGAPPLDEFAAMLAATDVLVTVDTMAAHLAGAMGHPALVALPVPPHFSFYWGLCGQRNSWYPSVRLYRQRRRHDWADAVAGIAGALAVA